MVFRTTTALEGLLVLFDPTVQYVAVINKRDGGIRVFNAVTCSLHVDITKKLAAKHLVIPSDLSSACWSLQDGSQTPRLIVAGSRGRVVSFDISKASPIWSVEDMVSGQLSWIAASGSGTVAAVSSAGDVAVHDAATGKRKWKSNVPGQPLTHCAFPQETDRLVVASTYLFVFHAQEVAVKLSGHAAPVCCAVVTPDGELTLSGATGDSTVALFSSRFKKRTGDNASEHGLERSSKVPTRRAKLSLELTESPRSIACAACDSDGDEQAQGDCSRAFVAAAVTAAGTACVWGCTKEGKAWRGHLRASIRSTAAQESVLAVSFVSQHVLVVLYGVPMQPRIRRITLSPEASHQDIVLPSAGHMLAPTHLPENERAGSPRAIDLGADNAGLPVNARDGSDSAQDTVTPMDTDALPPHTTTNGLTSIDSNPTAAIHAANATGAVHGSAAELGRGIPEGEEPLMNRVSKLMSMVPHQRVTEADVQVAGAAVDTARQGAITAESLTVLLTQAIRAADDVLIDKVLSSGRGAVLKPTVARLAAADAPLFFTALVERLRRTPAHAASLLNWLRAMLTQHASVLAAAPSSRSAMSLLTQLAEQRTALLGPMLALRGRLDVLVASAQPADTVGVCSEHFKPLVKVNVADLKQRSLAQIIRGEMPDSDDGIADGVDDQERPEDAAGPLGYEMEDVNNPNDDEDDCEEEEIDQDDDADLEGDVDMDDAEAANEGQQNETEEDSDGAVDDGE